MPKSILTLNGSNQYGDIGYNASLAPTDIISMEAKVILADWTDTTHYHVVSKTQSGGWAITLNEPGLGVSAPNICFIIRANGAYNFCAVTTPAWTKNTRHTITGTYDGRILTLYLDKVSSATLDLGSTLAIQYANNNSIAVGCDPDSNSPIVTPDGSYLKGSVGYLYLTHSVMSQTLINQHHDGYYPIDANILGFWPFDKGSQKQDDISGNGFICTLVNTPTFVVGQFSSGTIGTLLNVTVGNGMGRSEVAN